MCYAASYSSALSVTAKIREGDVFAALLGQPCMVSVEQGQIGSVVTAICLKINQFDNAMNLGLLFFLQPKIERVKMGHDVQDLPFILK